MPRTPETGLPADKIAHALFYLPLGAAVAAALSVRGRKPAAALALGGLTAASYGLGLELLQALLPWRSFEWLDAAMDLAGGLAGAGFGARGAGRAGAGSEL